MGRKKRRFKRGTDKRGSLAYLNGESLKRRGGESKSEGSPPQKNLTVDIDLHQLADGFPDPVLGFAEVLPLVRSAHSLHDKGAVREDPMVSDSSVAEVAEG